MLSQVAVVVAILGVPLLIISTPVAAGPAIGVAALVGAVLLGGFGLVAAVLLMLRARSGRYLLPRDLRLPVPRALRPYGL